MILGENCTWHSAFIITSGGDSVTLVGSLNETRIRETSGYEVICYKEGIGKALIEQLERFSPRKIVINFSENDVMSDGLSRNVPDADEITRAYPLDRGHCLHRKDRGQAQRPEEPRGNKANKEEHRPHRGDFRSRDGSYFARDSGEGRDY